MNYIIYIFIAIFLSFLWLLFFLKKDKNPESKKIILAVFILGGLMAFVAGIVQIKMVSWFDLKEIKEFPLLFFLFYELITISFIEEFLKFFAVKISIINHTEFDEPIDAMIYMIVSAIGFATVENFLYLVRFEGIIGETVYQYALYLGFLRFIGANLLHILSSAVVGFFVAISLLKIKKKFLFTSIGIFLGTILHALYNLVIIETGEYNFFLSSVLLIILSIFVIYYGFWKLKKIKSICQL